MKKGCVLGPGSSSISGGPFPYPVQVVELVVVGKAIACLGSDQFRAKRVGA